MRRSLLIGALAGLCTTLSGMAQEPIVLENQAFRLELSADGRATSLTIEGRECLQGESIPFCTLTQNRPYDNENFLIFPAKPKVFPANRIEKDGDTLRVSFQDTYDTAVIALKMAGRYIGFSLERVDYRIESLGIKRKTEIDAFTLLQLPVARKEHFGEWLNVTWDAQDAVCVLGTDPKTRIDASEEPSRLTLWAGLEEGVGLLGGQGAALIACPTPDFLDSVKEVEEDYRLPRGVDSRRRADYRDSYYELRDFDLSNIDRHLAYAKAGGFKAVVVYYRDFAYTCGHFLWNEHFPDGVNTLKAICDRIRAAGMVPGFHIHYSKVSTDDPYIAGGKPERRLNYVANLLLTAPLLPDDTQMEVSAVPANLRWEEGRRLLQIDSELLSYEAVDGNRLIGLKRGLFGSTVAAYPAGSLLRQPDADDWPRFIRISQEGGLQEEIAARLADIYSTCGFQFLYFDGAEDVPAPYWYNVSRAQMAVYGALGDKPYYSEGALKSHFGWHILTRGNAFDLFPAAEIRTAMRRYTLRGAARNADDFTAVDFGWTGYFLPDSVQAGSQPDTYAYICSKAAAWDSPISQVADLAAFDAHPRTADNLEVIRRWECAKAGLSQEEKERMKDPDKEFILLDKVYEARLLPDRGSVRAYLFEREGKACLLYWDTRGEGSVTLNLPGKTVLRDLQGRRLAYRRKGALVTLQAGALKVLETSLTQENLTQEFCNL